MASPHRKMNPFGTPIIAYPGHRLSFRLIMDPHKVDEFILQEMDRRVRLENREYIGFQILKPEGFQNHVLYHRLDQGIEALLSALFETITDVKRYQSDKEVSP